MALKLLHTVASLRSEHGEIIDSQMTAPADRFITVELAKFDKSVAEIETDLEKLVYTMKTLHTTEPTQYPAFWDEEWLRRAIEELDTRKMTPEERAYFARVTAANAEAVKAEKQRIDAVKRATIRKLLIQGKLTTEEIADANDMPIEVVLGIQKEY